VSIEFLAPSSTAIQTADAQTILKRARVNAASARMLRVSFGVM
jgi:hypothetical protein